MTSLPRYITATNQNSLFQPCDWLSANQYYLVRFVPASFNNALFLPYSLIPGSTGCSTGKDQASRWLEMTSLQGTYFVVLLFIQYVQKHDILIRVIARDLWTLFHDTLIICQFLQTADSSQKRGSESCLLQINCLPVYNIFHVVIPLLIVILSYSRVQVHTKLVCIVSLPQTSSCSLYISNFITFYIKLYISQRLMRYAIASSLI